MARSVAPAWGGGGGEPGPQRVAGEVGDLELGEAGGSDEDPADRPVAHAIGEEMVPAIHDPEQGARVDLGEAAPALEGDHRVGLLVAARRDADLLARRLGVGLAAPDAQQQAAVDLADVGAVEGSDLGAAQGAGEAEEEDAVVAHVAEALLRGGRHHLPELGDAEGRRLGAGSDSELAADAPHDQTNLEFLGGGRSDTARLVGEGDGRQLEVDPGGGERQGLPLHHPGGLGEVADVASESAGGGR